MPHQESQNNRQGEQSTSPDVAPLLPLSRPFAERVENLPQRHLCGPKTGVPAGRKREP